jgi:hypothetical protein
MPIPDGKFPNRLPRQYLQSGARQNAYPCASGSMVRPPLFILLNTCPLRNVHPPCRKPVNSRPSGRAATLCRSTGAGDGSATVLLSTAMRRTDLPLRLFRLAAGALAVLGLNGHGLAMLLMAVAMPVDAAAQHDFPFSLEICTPQGITTLSQSAGGPGGDAESDGIPEPAPKSTGIDACPVCTAFAQAGSGDLPQSATDHDYSCCRAAWQIQAHSCLPGQGSPQAQSRGPPAA